MRLNRFVALATGTSRRHADVLIEQQRLRINDHLGQTGETVAANDTVTLDGQPLTLPATMTIMLNKPVGYVCSRQGQGSQTIYTLLPPELHHLKPVGRLDKDSSGLLIMTNDGQLANQLTHPSYRKEKVYEISLNEPLLAAHKASIERGIKLDDGLSALQLEGNGRNWTVTMNEGRNRQIRRTFAALGYRVTKLHRQQSGPYQLHGLAASRYKVL